MAFETEPISKLPIIIKDPDNDLDYSVSFVDFLNETGDNIASAEVTSESGDCTISNIIINAGRVSANISGGTHGRFEPIKYRITTSSVPPKQVNSTILLHIKPE